MLMRLQELFEAAPSRVVADRIYWHGTNNTAGEKVFREGFVVGSMRPRGGNYLPPLLPGIYMTPRVDYALNFAKWDNKQKYGWLFACHGSKLIDVEIDEDEVGIALKMALLKERHPQLSANAYITQFERAKAMALSDEAFRNELLATGRKHLGDDELRLLADRNHGGETARAGAQLIPFLRSETKLKMIDQGCHIAHGANLIPDMAWRFPPKDAQRINNEIVIPGRNTVEVLDRLTERMR